MDLEGMARQIAVEYGLDPEIFVRQIRQESGFNPDAVSKRGAVGLAQIMPKTAADPGYGVTPISEDLLFDEDANLRFAAEYMRAMLDKFGDYPRALAAYNAGPGAVEEHQGIPPFEETQKYVNSILQLPTPQQPAPARFRNAPAEGIMALPAVQKAETDTFDEDMAAGIAGITPPTGGFGSVRVPELAPRPVLTAMERLGGAAMG